MNSSREHQLDSTSESWTEVSPSSKTESLALLSRWSDQTSAEKYSADGSPSAGMESQLLKSGTVKSDSSSEDKFQSNEICFPSFGDCVRIDRDAFFRLRASTETNEYNQEVRFI